VAKKIEHTRKKKLTKRGAHSQYLLRLLEAHPEVEKSLRRCFIQVYEKRVENLRKMCGQYRAFILKYTTPDNIETRFMNACDAYARKHLWKRNTDRVHTHYFLNGLFKKYPKVKQEVNAACKEPFADRTVMLSDIFNANKEYFRGSGVRPEQFANACVAYGRRAGWVEKGKPSKSSWIADESFEVQKLLKSKWKTEPSLEKIAQDLIDAGAKKRVITANDLINAGRTLFLTGRKKLFLQQRDVWNDVPGLSKRLTECFKSGVIAKRGIDAIAKELKQEFAEALKEKSHRLTIKDIKAELEALFWTKDRESSMKEAIRGDMTFDEWYKYHDIMPLSLAKEKWRWMTGATTSSPRAIGHISGFNRFKELFDLKSKEVRLFSFPEHSFASPFSIPVSDADNWSVSLPNAFHIGAVHSRNIEENPARLSLVDARRRGDAAVILSNMFHLDIAKKDAGGPLNVLRALVAGYNPNVDLLDEAYQEEAQAILEGKSDDLLYERTEEAFKNLLQGLRKVCVQPDGSPEYPGPVYVLLGWQEEALAAAIARWEMLYRTELLRLKLDSEIRVAKKAGNITQAEILQARRSRTVISNVRYQRRERFQQALVYIVKQIEATIPNAVVIGMGSACFKIGSATLEVKIPSHDRVTGSLLDDEVSGHTPKVLRRELADATVICHPFSLGYRSTNRERDSMGKRGRDARIIIAPVLINDEYVRARITNTVRKAHQLSRLVSNEQFCPGVVRLTCCSGMVNTDDLSIKTLLTHANIPHKEGAQLQTIPGGYGKSKYIYFYFDTDRHYGSRNREHIWIPEQESYGGVGEATIALLRRAGMCTPAAFPIHCATTNDDGVQGNHFQVQQQPHPQQVPYAFIEQYLSDAKKDMLNADTPEKRAKCFSDTRDFILRQFLLRGVDWTQDQVEEVFARHIEPNLDFYNCLISRALQSGLRFRGISELAGVPFDGRDIGACMIGTGNHFAKTVNKEMTEGVLYARSIRERLRALPKWRDKEEVLKKYIKAPLYSNQFIAWGIIETPGGCQFGIDFRSTPDAHGVNWNDPLLKVINNDYKKRGNYSRIFDGVEAVFKTFGDKHFHASASTARTIYHMTASSTTTDLFGELGFPPNNTGNSIVGLPADGFASGPVIRRVFCYRQVKELVEKPGANIDWEKFLPNPL